MRKRHFAGRKGTISPRGYHRGSCGGIPKRDGSGRGVGNLRKRRQ